MRRTVLTLSWRPPAAVLALVLAAVALAQDTKPADPVPTGLTAGRQSASPTDGAMMCYVPAGACTIGSPGGEGEENEHPDKRVTLDAYWIDRTEVTWGQYGRFLQAIKKSNDHGKCFKGEPPNKDHAPKRLDWKYSGGVLVAIDWYDAYAYAAWAGKRLPTEAEWEHAARGPQGFQYPWGNDFDATKAVWVGNGVSQPRQPGTCPGDTSPYGCLDMAGNVMEWCGDWYAADAYAKAADTNPTGPDTGERRVIRGGSHLSYHPDALRAAFRWRDTPDARQVNLGFRCVAHVGDAGAPK
jgi:formylglycine-generating enzyme required for sulfatase activity